MTGSAIVQVAQTLFSGTWGLFSGVQVPGLGISFAAFILGIASISVLFKIFWILLGMRSGAQSNLAKGNNRKIKISRERIGDER